MRFKRFGRTYQLAIETAEDLEEVLSLDESLWMATSGPTAAFRCDPEFLALVDSRGDGRICSDELRGAIRWLLDRLADRGHLREGTDTLPLSAIRCDTDEGRTLLDSAGYVLESLGQEAAEAISLNQVRSFMAGLKGQALNGDGVIVPRAASDPETARFIEDVLACAGAAEDASGEPGIREHHIDEFMAAVNAYLEWKSGAEIPAGQISTELMPLGEQTPRAYELYHAFADKVDLFFMQCRAVGFQAATGQTDGPGPISATGSQIPDLTSVEGVQNLLRGAPLARPNPERTLPLREDAVNPFYRQWLSALRESVLRPVLGDAPAELSEEDWSRVKSVLAPYEAYLREKKGSSVEALPAERLRQYRDGPFEQRTRELIEADRVVAAKLNDVQEVERLLLYHQNLMRLANNFVSFPGLFSTGQKALFEMGSAVIDGRWFNFAVRVEDLAAHSAMARMSNLFVLYLEITGPAAQASLHVAVPVTSGTKGNLHAGKRGVFFDTDGREHEARIVQIIENPVSAGEALAAPFLRLWRFVAGKIEALSTRTEADLKKGVDQTVSAATQAPAAQPQPAATGGVAGPAGLLVGVSVAIAALSSAYAFILKTLSGLEEYQIALGLGGAVLVVLVPAGIVAIMKLRRQDLSALLEGCGWAINARMRLTRTQRKHFTTRAHYPKGAEGTPRRRWARILLALILAAVLLAAGYYAVRTLVPRPRPRQAPPAAEPAGAPAPDDAPAPQPAGTDTEQSGPARTQ